MARSDFKCFAPIDVRFNEVDRQGIVHNSVHLVYFGVAMGQYLRSLPYDRAAMNARHNVTMHVITANITYHAPIRMDDKIEVGTRISKLGRTSFTIVYEIYRAGTDDLLVSGSQVWVNTGVASHRPAAWPEEFRAALRQVEPHVEDAARPGSGGEQPSNAAAVGAEAD